MQKVLIIEDSGAISQMMRAAIECSGEYLCEIAVNYKQAEALLGERAEDFFCALVDIGLPDAPHGEAVDLVLGYHIATVVYTGQMSEALRDEMVSKGIADYVLKQGRHNVEYVVYLVDRLYHNAAIKVLVVDDSRLSRRMMANMLKAQRFQVLMADSGPDAISVLEQHSDIRIALLDYHMEAVNGADLAMELRQTYAKNQLAIIGVSGQEKGNVSARFIKSGANDFLLKPFLPEEFNCRLNQNADAMDQMLALQQANQMKNQLLATAAHDIRNPLSVIKGMAEFLLKRTHKTERVVDGLQTILRRSGDMLDLLTNLLNVSAIESGRVALERESVLLPDLIREQVDIYHAAAQEKDITIICEFSDETSEPIALDLGRIKQVLDNLLTNAIKYSPLGAEVIIQLYRQNACTYVCFKDRGEGIKPHERDKLFGVFQTLSSKPTGNESSNGMGLAICKNFVEAHDGNIYYQDRDGGGSEFGVCLPEVFNV